MQPPIPKDVFTSVAWSALTRWLTAERESLRAQNDDETLEAVPTALLRGELRLINRILALPSEADRPPPQTPDFYVD